VNPDQLFSAPRFLAENVVANPVKPGGKLRLAAEAADVFIGANEGLLGEIVRQSDIAADELAEQASDDRLVAAHQLGEGVMVVIDKNSRDKICIGQRHAPQSTKLAAGCPL